MKYALVFFALALLAIGCDLNGYKNEIEADKGPLDHWLERQIADLKATDKQAVIVAKYKDNSPVRDTADAATAIAILENLRELNLDRTLASQGFQAQTDCQGSHCTTRWQSPEDNRSGLRLLELEHEKGDTIWQSVKGLHLNFFEDNMLFTQSQTYSLSFQGEQLRMVVVKSEQRVPGQSDVDFEQAITLLPSR